MIARTSLLNLLLMIAGFALWGLAFNILYGVLSLGCELAWQRNVIGSLTLLRLLLLALWAMLLAFHAWLLVWLWRRLSGTPLHPKLDRFVQIVSVSNAGLGLIATTMTGAVVAFLSPCAS